MTASPPVDGAGLAAADLCSIPKEAFGYYTLADLREYCKAFGLKPVGRKVDIIASLTEHLQILEEVNACSKRCAAAAALDADAETRVAAGTVVDESTALPDVLEKVKAGSKHPTSASAVDASARSLALGEAVEDEGSASPDVLEKVKDGPGRRASALAVHASARALVAGFGAAVEDFSVALDVLEDAPVARACKSAYTSRSSSLHSSDVAVDARPRANPADTDSTMLASQVRKRVTVHKRPVQDENARPLEAFENSLASHSWDKPLKVDKRRRTITAAGSKLTSVVSDDIKRRRSAPLKATLTPIATNVIKGGTSRPLKDLQHEIRTGSAHGSSISVSAKPVMAPFFADVCEDKAQVLLETAKENKLDDGGKKVDMCTKADDLDEIWSLKAPAPTEESGFTREDPESSGNATITVEVRLAFSGVLVTHAKVRLKDTVRRLQHIVSTARSWPPGAQQLCVGSLILEASMRLSTIGLHDGSVVMVTCHALQWHEKLKGTHALIEEDGVTVTRRERRSKFNNAVVVMNGPTRSFQFEVLDNSATFAGGLEVGFTQMPPEDLTEAGLPPLAMSLRHAWICDCYGELHANTGSFHCFDVDLGLQIWDPVRLGVGDVVSCRATATGRMQIDVNGHGVADWDAKIPAQELYPVVGLFGKTAGIKLLKSDCQNLGGA